MKIDWERVSKMQVVKKLKTILIDWFGVDLLFLDSAGKFQPYGSEVSGFACKNPLTQFLMAESNRIRFEEQLSELLQRPLGWQDSKSRPLEPFVGCAGFAAKIFYTTDWVGSVVAYPYLKQKFDPKVGISLWGDGLNKLDLKALKVLTVQEENYLSELVKLIADEIFLFHTEILKREEKIESLTALLDHQIGTDLIIGQSEAMEELDRLLERIGDSEASVLIQGENGTGKELIARKIHRQSPQRAGPFVPINCSAFNENLLESELFGHVRGAFTGAIKDKKGLFELADQGTLFLDEIGDMPLAMQVKLLRVIQESTFTPVGGVTPKKAHVRLIAATHRNLEERIEQGFFREDLYYRIKVINLTLPPLRERKEDIPLLIDHFLELFCKQKKQPLKKLSPEVFKKLGEHHWPGNIRELENEIHRLVILSGTQTVITTEWLSDHFQEKQVKTALSSKKEEKMNQNLKEAVEELEKKIILDGLEKMHWNKSRLARKLGISRASLIVKIEKYGLDKRRGAKPSLDA